MTTHSMTATVIAMFTVWVVAHAACGGKAVVDGEASGASSSRSSVTASSSRGAGASGPTTTIVSATGGGAGPPCATCNDFINGNAVFPDDMCGFTPPDSCDNPSSCLLADDYLACACDTAAGACGEIGTGPCDSTLCAGTGPDNACQACVATQCSAELNACTGDT